MLQPCTGYQQRTARGKGGKVLDLSFAYRELPAVDAGYVLEQTAAGGILRSLDCTGAAWALADQPGICGNNTAGTRRMC